MRSEGYSSWVCVCVCVCVCPYTFSASVRFENRNTYSAGNEGEKICSILPETAPLQRYTASCIVWAMIVRHFGNRACA